MAENAAPHAPSSPALLRAQPGDAWMKDLTQHPVSPGLIPAGVAHIYGTGRHVELCLWHAAVAELLNSVDPVSMAARHKIAPAVHDRMVMALTIAGTSQ